MPSKHDQDKALIGWWAPSSLRKRLEALMSRRGTTKTVILNEALSEYLDRNENSEDPKC